MQDTPTISATSRERTGTRYSQRLRKQGRLPAVIYGHKKTPLSVSIDEKEILILLNSGAHVLEVKVEGGSKETCLVKDLQFGYLGDNVIHVDFARVDLDEEVTVNVHLNFVGVPESAKKTEAILTHDITELEIICKVNAIPEEIRVDLTAMGEDTLFTIGQIELPAGLKATADSESPVCHISFVHQEEAEGEEVEVDSSAAEPEVITEAKTDDKDGDAKKESDK